MQPLFDDLQKMLANLNEKNKVISVENKRQTIYYYYFIICLSQLILDKKTFKKNKVLVEFLELNYKFQYPIYITKSRMMILGRTIQNVYKISNIENIKVYLNRTYEILRKLNENNNLDDINKLEDWADAISKMEIK
ncbi:hypothetical protein [Clostridium cagae]|uniref:hypothetical protein n=1 Tax=Clostridium cagae TaxID=2080751 RepID=UPI000CF6C61A|nr:hypothetical protein [Clostridium cagae]